MFFLSLLSIILWWLKIYVYSAAEIIGKFYSIKTFILNIHEASIQCLDA